MAIEIDKSYWRAEFKNSLRLLEVACALGHKALLDHGADDDYALYVTARIALIHQANAQLRILGGMAGVW